MKTYIQCPQFRRVRPWCSQVKYNLNGKENLKMCADVLKGGEPPKKKKVKKKAAPKKATKKKAAKKK
jgi:hypothetical protein